MIGEQYMLVRFVADLILTTKATIILRDQGSHSSGSLRTFLNSILNVGNLERKQAITF